MATQAEKQALGLPGDASEEDVQEAIAKLVAGKEAAESAASLAKDQAAQAEEGAPDAKKQAEEAEAEVEEALRQAQEAEERAARSASEPPSLDEEVPAVLPEGTFKVKHLRFEYRVEVPDASKPGETTYVVREAKQGELITPQVQADIEKGRKHGAFFTDRELTLQGVKGGNKAPGDKSDQELIDWLLNEHPSAADTVNAAGGDAHLAQRILDAESAATGGEPRQEVVKGFSTILNES